MNLADFRPKSQLITQTTQVKQPRFRVIEAHNHLGDTVGSDWDQRPLSELLDLMDAASIDMLVDLDGGWGESYLHAHLDKFKQAAPTRFQVFGGIDWSAWKTYGNTFGQWAAQSLRAQVSRGAQGLKIWKPFGLTVTDHHNKRVAVDDQRLDPIWQTAAELRIPVLIHIADPVAFFEPVDATNERWEELKGHPDWQFPAPAFPAFNEIIQSFANLISHHPQTTFIGAHVGCFAENLSWVSSLLDHCPNFYIDFSARIAELGRQPYSARRFFIDYADRILFGTDLYPALSTYQRYYRFLETDDEYFNYGDDPLPTQGRWRIYGLYLPDDVLKKVYQTNALRILQPN